MISLGTMVHPYGKVVAVGWVGERYYWMIKKGVVSMIPASALTEHSDVSILRP